MLVIPLIFAIVLIVLWLVNRTVNSRYYDSNHFLIENPGSEHYVIKRISQHLVAFHSGDEERLARAFDTTTVTPDAQTGEEIPSGWIYLNKELQQYYFQETYPEDGHETQRWITINKDGAVINSKSMDSLMPPSGSILLKDEKGNFPDWKNKNSNAWMNFFSRETFNWSVFNPFKGMGSPTGGGGTSYWYGHGYYTVAHAREKIDFKEPAASTNSGYRTGLNFSVTPPVANSMPPLTFIIVSGHSDRKGLYVIVKR